jgi:hypothetical protein
MAMRRRPTGDSHEAFNIERAFSAADTRKAGKLDMKQTAVMLREFDPRAVGVRPTLPRP